MVWDGTVWGVMLRYGVVWSGMAWRGMACMAWCGMVEVWYGVAWYLVSIPRALARTGILPMGKFRVCGGVLV